MGICETRTSEIRHGVRLTPYNVIEYPELLILQDCADAEDIVIAPHDPYGAIWF